MKANQQTIYFLLSTFFCLSFMSVSQAQSGDENLSTITMGRGTLTTVGGHLRLKSKDLPTTKETIELQKKKYLTFSYELVTVDDFDRKAHLRYNIFEDEMEFVRENNLYYLVKEIGRKVHFEETKSTFKVYQFNDKLGYYKVMVDGNLSLLAKHRVRYFEPRPAESGYDKAKPAKYKRQKDELYLAVDQRIRTKLSGIKKSDFLSYFGNRSQEMEDFMKNNKLSYKKAEHLVKILGYYNTF